jgi:hypothetical protein
MYIDEGNWCSQGKDYSGGSEYDFLPYLFVGLSAHRSESSSLSEIKLWACE